MKTLTILTTLLLAGCEPMHAELITGPATVDTNFLQRYIRIGASVVATNYLPPVRIEPSYGSPATNIVILTNYTGTIQMGTNFYTRKDFDDLAVIPKGNFGMWRAMQTKAGKAISLAQTNHWTDWFNDGVYCWTNTTYIIDEEANKNRPDVSTWLYGRQVSTVITNKVYPTYFHAGDRDVELGARSDGVIVWRERR